MIQKSDVFEKNNLELSFQRLKFSSRHIHKKLYRDALKDIEAFREDYFGLVIDKYRTINSVDDHCVVRVYLPKTGGFVRPITYIGFEALLIYQSIANKLAESFYETMSRNYNKLTFGNHFNCDFSSPFMFSPWKERWKRYQQFSKSLIEENGFNFVVDFDIASFYDSIDHKLLENSLNKYLDENLIDLLLSILKLSHSDFKHITPCCGSGIPQGPVASIVIAEIFLHFYLDQFFLKQVQRNEVSYIRYADDIRVFSRNKSTAQKFITLLDLLCRNSGLIAQSSKVGVKFYTDSRTLIDEDVKKFSQIQTYYKRTGSLKAKDSRRALNLIKEMLKSGIIDKTKFNFYIYKVEKDEELKDLILANICEKYEFCDPMLAYLKKHYSEDNVVINKLTEFFIINDNFFLDYPLYSLLEIFQKHLPFNSDYFYKIFNRKETGKWLSKISLIKWALYYNEKEVLDSLNVDDIENILLKREILSAQHKLSNGLAVKQQRELKMLNSSHPDLLFKAINLIYGRVLFDTPTSYSFSDLPDNYILNKVLKGKNHNPVADTLKKQYPFHNNVFNLFSIEVFDDENEFEQLSVLCNFLTIHYKEKSYKLFIDSIDQFNHILVERLFYIKNGNRPSENYGALLENESFLSLDMIGVRDIFLNIHKIRNGELHPKDKKTNKFHSGNMAFQQKKKSMDKIFSDWLEAVQEILNWYSITTYERNDNETLPSAV